MFVDLCLLLVAVGLVFILVGVGEENSVLPLECPVNSAVTTLIFPRGENMFSTDSNCPRHRIRCMSLSNTAQR